MTDIMTDMASQTPSLADGTPVTGSILDEFERGLLPVLRCHLTSLSEPETQAWHTAYTMAGQHWGDAVGLAVAHALFDVVRAAAKATPGGFSFHDPHCRDTRQVLTTDELRLIGMLHHMRRNETAAARMAAEALTDGGMEPDLIRASLRFAARFPAGLEGWPGLRQPAFKVVR